MLTVKVARFVVGLRRAVARLRGGLMTTLLFSLLVPGGVATAGKPVIDESYANGEVVYMIGPHVKTNPNPNEFAQAEELYIVAYPLNGTPPSDTTPKSLPGGYVPQCNPCYHFGTPSQGDAFAYHDHILSGSPGFGRDGTAGTFKGPWRIILLMYKASAVAGAFTPAKSAEELDTREEQGMFEEINPGAENPYELELPVILICPLVSSHA